MTVFASGRQKRAFLSVFDLCRFIDEHLTDEAFDDPKVYNVGNPGNTTEIYDLAARIKAKTGSESTSSTPTPPRSTAPSTRRPRASRSCPSSRTPPPWAGSPGWTSTR